MNLHEWITRQVERAEASARRAAECTAAHRWEAIGSIVVAVPDKDTAGPDIIEATFHAYDDALVHAALNDPATVLRRCEADRRILERHRMDPAKDNWSEATACAGCGVYSDCDWPVTENLNDCPELADLAHAHGITDDILNTLDRPQPPPRKPLIVNSSGLHVGTPMQDMPAGLRGPRWNPAD